MVKRIFRFIYYVLEHTIRWDVADIDCLSVFTKTNQLEKEIIYANMDEYYNIDKNDEDIEDYKGAIGVGLDAYFLDILLKHSWELFWRTQLYNLMNRIDNFLYYLQEKSK